jgi:hypothetical protein
MSNAKATLLIVAGMVLLFLTANFALVWLGQF